MVSGSRKNKEPLHWFTVELHDKTMESEKTTHSHALNAQKTTQKSTQKSTQKQQEILLYLKGNPTAGRKTIAIGIGNITEDGVKANLYSLQQKGLLRRIGSAKGGYWEAVEKDTDPG